ncbi:MAG: serine/threonine protein kinase [Myxococcales bacterium]|nr:serine/threonine protein kinase [Myxococcales bacterium]
MTEGPAQAGLAATSSCPSCGVRDATGNQYCTGCGRAQTRLQPDPKQGPVDPLISEVIDGRFRVLSRLGQGGMGTVYLAEHVGIGKRVAVKVLRAERASNSDLPKRFRREAMLVSQLTDAHTIAVFDYGVWRGIAYLVMEYLRGEDLAALLDREGRLPAARAVAIAHQICSSLGEAHAVGLVHRDLKPENVFIMRTSSGDEFIKVLDFGLAKTVQGGFDVGSSSDAFQTAHGAIVGTPYFMSPEQVRGEPVDGRTDLYALGALLYRMIGGDFPHRGLTVMHVLEAHLSGVVRPLSELIPNERLPEGCESLIRRLLSKDKDSRPSGVRETMDALLAVSKRALSQTGADPNWERGTFEGLKPEELDDPAAATRREFARFSADMRRRLRLWWTLVLMALVGIGAVVSAYVCDRPVPILRSEVEPNDETNTATRLTVGAEMSAYIGRRLRRDVSDRDVFDLQADPGAEVSASVSGVPGMDLVLEGYGKDGEMTFRADAFKAGEGEGMMSVVVPKSGLYLIVREVWVQYQTPTENSTDAYNLVVTPR